MSPSFLQSGANVAAANRKDKNHPLHIAVTTGVVDAAVAMTDLLLKYDADPDARNIRGFTALASASKHAAFPNIRATIIKWIDWKKVRFFTTRRIVGLL